jgi:hypothetical protein
VRAKPVPSRCSRRVRAGTRSKSMASRSTARSWRRRRSPGRRSVLSVIGRGLGVTLSNPTGGGGSIHQDFFNFCGGSNNGGPALDVTSLFKPGTNTFSLTLTNDCGGIVFAPALYLVVTQH